MLNFCAFALSFVHRRFIQLFADFSLTRQIFFSFFFLLFSCRVDCHVSNERTHNANVILLPILYFFHRFCPLMCSHIRTIVNAINNAIRHIIFFLLSSFWFRHASEKSNILYNRLMCCVYNCNRNNLCYFHLVM